jgi:hypothetical protein
MRCRACNAELDDLESVRKDTETGEFLDLCSDCLSAVRYAQFEDDFNINDVVTVVSDQEM